MKKILLLVLIWFAVPAGAATLSVAPLNSNLLVGETFSFDVNVSGLGGETLSGWSFEIEYDPALLSSIDVVFGPYMGPLGDELANAYWFDDPVSGRLYADTFSFIPNEELDALQGDSFRLATISFSGISDRVSQLNLINPELVSIFAEELEISLGSSIAYIRVPQNPVPEPGTIILLAIGLVIILGFKKK